MSLDHYNSLALSNDLYQLTMAQGYYQDGRQHDDAVFHAFFRECPFEGNYAVAAGMGSLKAYLDSKSIFDLSDSDLSYLSELEDGAGESLFEEDFLEYLRDMEFECSISAVREGEIVFPHEPMVRVEGPLIQAQLIETPILNFINYQSLVATKASRITQETDCPVLEFGLRRAQGPDGGLSAARGSYIGGAAGTSNVQAGKQLGIPIKGTHAHSWVQSYDSEKDAFRSFAESQPNSCTFLVDTYDSLRGIDRAIEVAREKDLDTFGIRLDSGNLAELSKEARKRFESEGFPEAKIVASDGLEEHQIRKMEKEGHEIDAFGIGTNLVTCQGSPSFGGVYKLAAVKSPGNEWSSRMKLSEIEIKKSIPGILNTVRCESGSTYIGDCIYDRRENAPSEGDAAVMPFDNCRLSDHDSRLNEVSYQLLNPMFRSGKYVGDPSVFENIDRASSYRESQLRKMPEAVKSIDPDVTEKDSSNYPVGLSKHVYKNRERCSFNME